MRNFPPTGTPLVTVAYAAVSCAAVAAILVTTVLMGLLGALITFVLYGVGPVALVVYLMRAPARRKAIKARVKELQARRSESQPRAARDPFDIPGGIALALGLVTMLMAFNRMDNATWGSAYGCQGKAIASVAFGRASGLGSFNAGRYSNRGQKITPDQLLQQNIAYRLPRGADWDGTFDGLTDTQSGVPVGPQSSVGVVRMARVSPALTLEL